jgi:adenosyl cobinamide kinase/adenosyl cobinamide phosphate guanylyltransferase
MKDLEERSRKRREAMETYRTTSSAGAEAWPRRIESHYGRAPANWIDLDSLLAIKSAIDHPRHQEDARVLRAVRDRRDSG